MSSSLVITLAAIGGIIWLGFILVAALRRRGPEEIPTNLAPGTTDDALETRRLESGQKTAVLLSAFLAVSLPLYYLGEQQRQEGFVEQFSEESIDRGAALVEEFDCFVCHGPEGVGGAAPFVERRSGVQVSWVAPPLNDIFFRYDEDAINYWITYGRGNTPMPPWGVAGGGSMNEQAVDDVVNYLRTIQISQETALARTDAEIIDAQRTRLANADATVESALVQQRQVLADINKAEERAPVISELAARAREVLDGAGTGLDTDGDGLSDAAEVELVEIGEQIVDLYRVIEPVTLDPENPQSVEGQDDLTTAQGIIDRLRELVESGRDPVLVTQLEAATAAFEGGLVEADIGLSPNAIDALVALADEAPPGVANDIDDLASATAFVEALEAAAEDDPDDEALAETAGEARTVLDAGQDPDGDGLSSGAEQTISAQVTAALDATMPSEAVVPQLDPTNDATSGEPDSVEASRVVGGWESLATTTEVTANNIEPIRAGAQQGVTHLEEAQQMARWEIDIGGVAAAAFDGDTESAERAVLLFQGHCARCHTAGFSAGVPFTLEAGSGGFGPALWDGRPLVQFGEADENPDNDLLVQFIISGSEAEEPYGLNGFGSGRMPAFGMILTLEDITLLAQYLRGGDLTGLGPAEVRP